MDQFTPEMLGYSALLTLLCGIVVFAWQDRATLAGWFRALFNRYFVVKRSAPAAGHDYVYDADDRPAERPNFRTSRAEVEAEAARRFDPEAADGFVTITEKALQEKIAAAREQGMVELFAIVARYGLIPAGKATEIKRAAFGVSDGRQLQRLNRAIDAVALPDEPAPTPALTPLAGRPVPAGVAFAEDE